MGQKRNCDRRKFDRKNWSPDDPCIKCSDYGPHLIEFSHGAWIGGVPVNNYKCSCRKCGAYQKFISETTAMSYVKGKP